MDGVDGAIKTLAEENERLKAQLAEATRLDIDDSGIWSPERYQRNYNAIRMQLAEVRRAFLMRIRNEHSGCPPEGCGRPDKQCECALEMLEEIAAIPSEATGGTDA